MNMKFALAAGVCAAALAGFSDVSSANVVGYMNTTTPGGGNKMIAPMFINVNSASGIFKLSDLRCTDYDPAEGSVGDFTMTVLTPGGSAAVFTQEEADANPALQKYVGKQKKFCWYDDPEDEELEVGWYDVSGSMKWDENAIEFKSSQAFWTLGYGVSLQTAGQVGASLVTITTPAGGNVAAGNPFPVTVCLKDLYCDGYDPEDGSVGDFTMTILTAGGNAAKFTEEDGIPEYVGKQKKFCWYDDPEDEELPVGWYDHAYPGF